MYTPIAVYTILRAHPTHVDLTHSLTHPIRHLDRFCRANMLHFLNEFPTNSNYNYSNYARLRSSSNSWTLAVPQTRRPISFGDRSFAVV